MSPVSGKPGNGKFLNENWVHGTNNISQYYPELHLSVVLPGGLSQKSIKNSKQMRTIKENRQKKNAIFSKIYVIPSKMESLHGLSRWRPQRKISHIARSRERVGQG